MFLFDLFINHLPKINRSVLRKVAIDLLYFWDIYDVNLWEKLAITVKPCFIETELKQSYDLQGYFLKIKETINAVTVRVIYYFSQWTFFRSSRSKVSCKNIVHKISQNLLCFSRSCSPSRTTKQAYFGNFTRPQTLSSPNAVGRVLGYTTILSFRTIFG